MQMKNFIGEALTAFGAYVSELTLGIRTSTTAFFMIDAQPSYTLLLGTD